MKSPAIPVVKARHSPYTFLGIFLIFFTLNLLFFGKQLSEFVLNGDDVYMLLEAPGYAHNFINKLTSFSGQYRPLGRLLYNAYLPLRYNFQAIYLSHLILFSAIQFLFFLVARNKISITSAFALTFFIFNNPIFYYHLFTIASDINLFIIGIFLGMILSIQQKKYFIPPILFLLAIFLKETFVVLLPMVLYALAQSHLNRKKIITACSFFVGITTAYIIARFKSYGGTDENYQFVFTLPKLFENLGNISAWILNHPRGAEYGFYGFRNVWNYVLAGSNLLFWCLGLFFSLKSKNKVWLIVLLTTFVVSVLPFLFLNRTLVFYMDVPFVVLGLLLFSVFQMKKISFPLMIWLVSASILSYCLFFHKWVQYSFVGNSNFIAKNFVTFVENTSFEEDIMCITHHSLGAWPTSQGRLANFINESASKKIISVSNSHNPLCEDAVIIENVGAEYKLVEKSTYENPPTSE